jgi:hypothetical protein
MIEKSIISPLHWLACVLPGLLSFMCSCISAYRTGLARIEISNKDRVTTFVCSMPIFTVGLLSVRICQLQVEGGCATEGRAKIIKAHYSHILSARACIVSPSRQPNQILLPRFLLHTAGYPPNLGRTILA